MPEDHKWHRDSWLTRNFVFQVLGSVMVVATSLNDYREDFAAQGILPSFRASSRAEMMYAVNRVATGILAPLSVPAAVQSIGATSSVCTSLPGIDERRVGWY